MEIRGRELVDRIAGQLVERLGPAELVWSRVSREPEATLASASRRHAPAASRPSLPARRPRRCLDRYWLAGHDGGRRSERPRRGTSRSPVRVGRFRREHRRRADDARPHDRGRVTAPARAPGRRRLVGRRAGVERDDDRRAPLLAPRCSAYATGRPTASSRTSCSPAAATTARGRGGGTGPPDLSTTVEAYVALKMAGVDAGDETRAYIQREGGIAKVRVFTKCFLALLDAWPWQDIPTVPVELILLPPSAPLSVYNFACWARQTLVPLSVVQALRPLRPSGVDLQEIGARHGASAPPRPPSALRRRALATAEQWVRERQEADGSWGGIQPPWVWSILMLAALGYGLRRSLPAQSRGGLERLPRRGGGPAASRSLPVARSGTRRWPCLPSARATFLPTTPSSSRPASGCSARRSPSTGDWAVRRPELAPGGWAFEFENDIYPDVDDAAVVCLALRELEMGEDAVQRGLAWIAGMQSENGGWGAFDADNTSTWLYKLPFCDFGAVIDPPSEDVSAHALEVLAHETADTRPSCAVAFTTSSAASSATARGGVAGASIISTEQRRPRRRSRRAASAPAIPLWSGPRPGSTPCSIPTAASARTSARITSPPGGDAASPRLHKPRGH